MHRDKALHPEYPHGLVIRIRLKTIVTRLSLTAPLQPIRSYQGKTRCMALQTQPRGAQTLPSFAVRMYDHQKPDSQELQSRRAVYEGDHQRLAMISHTSPSKTAKYA